MRAQVMFQTSFLRKMHVWELSVIATKAIIQNYTHAFKPDATLVLASRCYIIFKSIIYT